MINILELNKYKIIKSFKLKILPNIFNKQEIKNQLSTL